MERYKIDGPIDYLMRVLCRDIGRYNELSDFMSRGELGVEKFDGHVVLAIDKAFQGYPIELFIEPRGRGAVRSRRGAYLERRRRTAYVATMCILFLRRLFIVLTGLAFLVGAGAQAMPSARLMAPALPGAGQTIMGVDCIRMAMHGPAAPTPMKQVPCKGISLDCAKQLGCISSPALPALAIGLGIPTAYARVAYWSPAASRAGLSIKPNLFPPIAA